MPNKPAAEEWLLFAEHDLTAAEMLHNAGHFSDTISFLLQQSLEKSLKSLLAYQNRKIRKSHDLMEIFSETQQTLKLTDEELDILDIATAYYLENRYPHANYQLPEEAEIKHVIKYSRIILQKIRNIIL